MRTLPPLFASVQKLLCLGCVLWGGSVCAQEAKVRASLATNDTFWVGQRVTVVVELLAPGFFDSAAAFDLPDPQGVLLLPPTEHPVVGSETVDGVNYTVQRHELAVFATRAGEQTVPPLTVRFQFKRQPLDKTDESAEVKTEALHFAAKRPPGAEGLGNVISARGLKVTETWQPAPDKTDVPAGAAFTRTVTFSAPDVPGMVFPPFPAGDVSGIGIYPKPPLVANHAGRGVMSGERRDTITYVCERAGKFTVPPAQFVWFDLETQQLRTNNFPARVFNVLPNPALAANGGAANSVSGAVMNPAREKRRVFIGLGGPAILIFLFVLLWKTRHVWPPLAAIFQPVRLQSLNPANRNQSKKRL